MKRVLIANRGEIALRIARACREESIESVAVYSSADRLSPHVRAADLAVHLGPAAPAESYLSIDRLLDAAHRAGADAVHPGYGFLAERAAFAKAVEDAGLVWIGPPHGAIAAMGDKTEARRRMEAAGVPIVPGANAPITEADAGIALARSIGYPVLVKAAAGGGGKGMRVVAGDADVAAALEAAGSEAARSFGDPSVYIEKFIERPRHIEIQVLADAERTIHLGERECSIQRRHQKLVEEAPSLAVTAELRERMGAAAVAAAAAVGYRGAGTCEFLLGADGSFYFLEMNTRIQVEHPVTEMVYGVDLVREQLRIAAGERMRVAGRALQPRGWAIECRITSEDAGAGFLPTTGHIAYLHPPGGPGVRWDAGVESGNEVTLFYDSMLAKLIVWAPDRAAAIGRMERALEELVLVGVATTQPFHRRLMADPEFRRGEVDIQFLDRRPDLAQPAADAALEERIAIAAALAEADARTMRKPAIAAAAGSADGAVSREWARVARREGLR